MNGDGRPDGLRQLVNASYQPLITVSRTRSTSARAARVKRPWEKLVQESDSLQPELARLGQDDLVLPVVVLPGWQVTAAGGGRIPRALEGSEQDLVLNPVRPLGNVGPRHRDHHGCVRIIAERTALVSLE